MTAWRSDMENAPRGKRLLFAMDWADDCAPYNPPLRTSQRKDEALKMAKFGCWPRFLKPVAWQPTPRLPRKRRPQ